jgi:transposase InsO family protein
MGIDESARYCVEQANGSIPSVYSGFGARKAYRCARTNARLDGLEFSTALRQRAEHANHVWSWDIIHDQTEAGSTLRILTLIDEYTKQCLAIVDRSIRAVDAIRVLGRTIERYGHPEQIRSDNGPEFIAQAIRQWMSTSQIKSFYSSRLRVHAGSPANELAGSDITLKA